MTEYIRRERMADEYIRRDDAMKAVASQYGACRSPAQNRLLDKIRNEIRRMPAADVAPVARCKECEHAERYERTDGTAGYYCGHPKNTFAYGERWDRVFKPVKEADDFCSYGTPKNDGGET